MQLGAGRAADELGDITYVELPQVDADVIVLATHGRTGLKRLLLGSVADYVPGEWEQGRLDAITSLGGE